MILMPSPQPADHRQGPPLPARGAAAGEPDPPAEAGLDPRGRGGRGGRGGGGGRGARAQGRHHLHPLHRHSQVGRDVS